jgi:hypothetical protein
MLMKSGRHMSHEESIGLGKEAALSWHREVQEVRPDLWTERDACRGSQKHDRRGRGADHPPAAGECKYDRQQEAELRLSAGSVENRLINRPKPKISWARTKSDLRKILPSLRPVRRRSVRVRLLPQG